MGTLDLDYTIYSRDDPVTGQTGHYIRKGSANQTSEELKNHQQCVRENMEGYTASGDTAEEKARNVRQKLSSVSKSCE